MLQAMVKNQIKAVTGTVNVYGFFSNQNLNTGNVTGYGSSAIITLTYTLLNLKTKFNISVVMDRADRQTDHSFQ